MAARQMLWLLWRIAWRRAMGSLRFSVRCVLTFCVGKTIRETCHRSALYAQLAGVDEETVVTPQLAARVVNDEGYGDRVYINKVESAADYEAAQAMANEFSCPVIAGSLHQGVYVCLH